MLPSKIRPPAAIGGQSRSMFDFTRFDDGAIAEQAAVGNNSRGTAGDAQKAQKIAGLRPRQLRRVFGYSKIDQQ